MVVNDFLWLFDVWQVAIGRLAWEVIGVLVLSSDKGVGAFFVNVCVCLCLCVCESLNVWMYCW